MRISSPGNRMFAEENQEYQNIRIHWGTSLVRRTSMTSPASFPSPQSFISKQNYCKAANSLCFYLWCDLVKLFPLTLKGILLITKQVELKTTGKTGVNSRFTFSVAKEGCLQPFSRSRDTIEQQNKSITAPTIRVNHFITCFSPQTWPVERQGSYNKEF